MPDITSAGTYDKDTVGFGALRSNPHRRVILFGDPSSGTPAMATTNIEYRMDNGTWQALENGTISTIPTSKVIDFDLDLRIVCSGSPNFNITVRN